MRSAAALLAARLLGSAVPPRFAAFAAVGLVGVGVQLAVLTALLRAGVAFQFAQASVAVVAMVGNYAGNNAVTYRDRRLVGTVWWLGLASSVTVRSVGAVANVGVASYLLTGATPWSAAAVAGVVVGAIWNFAISGHCTWRSRRGPAR